MKTILITGGWGYLGGRISKSLADIPCYYIKIGTKSLKLSKPNWLTQGTFVHLDMNDKTSIQEAAQDADIVIHLAGSNEIDSLTDPEQALVTTGLGTLRLIQAAKQATSFIYFSTAHVYGSPLVGTITEETLPQPTHPYAICHRVAEDYVLASPNGLVIRLSNSFGPPIHPDITRWTLIVNDLCKQAAQNKKLVLKTSGLQYRDFIPITDVVNAVQFFCEKEIKTLPYRLYNLGGDSAMPIIEMANLIAKSYEANTGYFPLIDRPTPSPQDESSILNYKIDRLFKSGFKLTQDFRKEIDLYWGLFQNPCFF